MKKICVLQSSYADSTSPFKEHDPYADPSAYSSKHSFTTELIKKSTAVQQIRDLSKLGIYDVFINLCDGGFDEDRAGKEVVEALERYNVPFTGADSKFYEPSKERIHTLYIGLRRSCKGDCYGVLVKNARHIIICIVYFVVT
jgi:D-alanine-D-alanine ligase